MQSYLMYFTEWFYNEHSKTVREHPNPSFVLLELGKWAAQHHVDYDEQREMAHEIFPNRPVF